MGNNSIWGNSHIVADSYPSVCTTISKKCHIVAYFRHTAINSPADANARIHTEVVTDYGFGVNHDTSPMENLDAKANGCLTELEA